MAGICDRTNFIKCSEIYPDRRNPNLSEKKLTLDTDDVSISVGNDGCNKVENLTLVIEIPELVFVQKIFRESSKKATPG